MDAKTDVSKSGIGPPKPAWRPVFDIVDRFFIVLGTVMAILGGLFICYTVFMRYFLGTTYDWSIEIPTEVVIGGALLLAGTTVRTREQINIDFLPAKFKGRSRVIFELTLTLMTLATSIFIGISSIKYISTLRLADPRSPTSLHTPEWWFIVPFTTGIFLCAFFCLEVAAKHLANLLSKSK